MLVYGLIGMVEVVLGFNDVYCIDVGYCLVYYGVDVVDFDGFGFEVYEFEFFGDVEVVFDEGDFCIIVF